MKELESLVVDAQKGDQEAFVEIVHRFQDMAYGSAYSFLRDFHLAQDVAQESFIEMYRQLPNLRSPNAFVSWFRRIVFKHADRIARSKKMQTVSLDAGAEMATSLENAANDLDSEQDMEAQVLAALHSLPEQQRMTVTLFYISGYSANEVAQFLEVPVTTVKKRLFDSRKKLKEKLENKIMQKVASALQTHSLPEDFAQRLLMFPFPRLKPSIGIVDCPDEKLEIRCTDAQSYFLPLYENARCDWTFYDEPEGRLSGVYECCAISAAPWQGGVLLREWTRYTDLKKEGKAEWKESYILAGQESFRFVKLGRAKCDGLSVSAESWANGKECEITPLTLKTQTKHGDTNGCDVLGVVRVTIGTRSWKCLKVMFIEDHQSSGSQSRPVLAEYYVADTGRTVLFRRYNGPGWRTAGLAGSFESLAGCDEVEYKGIVFRHWYDCIPDIAFGLGD